MFALRLLAFCALMIANLALGYCAGGATIYYARDAVVASGLVHRPDVANRARVELALVSTRRVLFSYHALRAIEEGRFDKARRTLEDTLAARIDALATTSYLGYVGRSGGTRDLLHEIVQWQHARKRTQLSDNAIDEALQRLKTQHNDTLGGALDAVGDRRPVEAGLSDVQ